MEHDWATKSSWSNRVVMDQQGHHGATRSSWSNRVDMEQQDRHEATGLSWSNNMIVKSTTMKGIKMEPQWRMMVRQVMKTRTMDKSVTKNRIKRNENKK
jgi:hypothetical protein